MALNDRTKRSPAVKGRGFDKSRTNADSSQTNDTSPKPKINKLHRLVFRKVCQIKGRDSNATVQQHEQEFAALADAHNLSFVEVLDAAHRGWDNATGDWTLDTPLHGWRNDSAPDVADANRRADSHYMDCLKVMARLQRHAGDGEIWISSDRLAEELGVKKRTAAAYLAMACRDGTLIMAEAAQPGRCRRWYFPAAVPDVAAELERMDEEEQCPF